MFEAEFWVAVATIIFVGVLIYMGVHKQVFDALDARTARIQAELDEARRLKEEAAKLVAEYRQKQAAAEKEAESLIESARLEAERYAADARVKLDEFVTRRTKMAETKIAQAEVQAMADVRAAAAEAAIAAAGDVLTHSAKGRTAEDLITRGIADVKSRLN
jgi:F-type H+-transporting ATPase subunit b